MKIISAIIALFAISPVFANNASGSVNNNPSSDIASHEYSSEIAPGLLNLRKRGKRTDRSAKKSVKASPKKSGSSGPKSAKKSVKASAKKSGSSGPKSAKKSVKASAKKSGSSGPKSAKKSVKASAKKSGSSGPKSAKKSVKASPKKSGSSGASNVYSSDIDLAPKSAKKSVSPKKSGSSGASNVYSSDIDLAPKSAKKSVSPKKSGSSGASNVYSEIASAAKSAKNSVKASPKKSGSSGASNVYSSDIDLAPKSAKKSVSPKKSGSSGASNVYSEIASAAKSAKNSVKASPKKSGSSGASIDTASNDYSDIAPAPKSAKKSLKASPKKSGSAGASIDTASNGYSSDITASDVAPVNSGNTTSSMPLNDAETPADDTIVDHEDADSEIAAFFPAVESEFETPASDVAPVNSGNTTSSMPLNDAETPADDTIVDHEDADSEIAAFFPAVESEFETPASDVAPVNSGNTTSALPLNDAETPADDTIVDHEDADSEIAAFFPAVESEFETPASDVAPVNSGNTTSALPLNDTQTSADDTIVDPQDADSEIAASGTTVISECEESPADDTILPGIY